MHFLGSEAGEASGGEAGGVTGLVNFMMPPGLGEAKCLFGICIGVLEQPESRSGSGMGGIVLGVSGDTTVGWVLRRGMFVIVDVVVDGGGGVSVALEITTAAMMQCCFLLVGGREAAVDIDDEWWRSLSRSPA